jgi:hypothetical protein
MVASSARRKPHRPGNATLPEYGMAWATSDRQADQEKNHLGISHHPFPLRPPAARPASASATAAPPVDRPSSRPDDRDSGRNVTRLTPEELLEDFNLGPGEASAFRSDDRRSLLELPVPVDRTVDDNDILRSAVSSR